MAWQFIVVLVLILAIAMAIGTGIIERHRRLIKIRQDARTISWEDALSRIRIGHGDIVKNDTSLPGRLWWIEDSDIVEQDALYDEVEKRGLCVMNPPTRKVVEQALSTENVSSSYRQLKSERLCRKP